MLSATESIINKLFFLPMGFARAPEVAKARAAAEAKIVLENIFNEKISIIERVNNLEFLIFDKTFALTNEGLNPKKVNKKSR